MAVGLKENRNLLPVPGLKLSACSAGIYKKQRPDLAIIACEPGTVTSAVFTRNVFCAAPVTLAREHLHSRAPLYLLINAGNANAGLGRPGYESAVKTCEVLAKLSGCNRDEVLPFSTGVIGEPLPVKKICEALPVLLEQLSENKWLEANRAILTTDTMTKAVSRQVTLDNRIVTVTGIAKGSGMIRPDMATMLAFIGTDATVDKTILDQILTEAVIKSFNCITVDGDTSTNDACVLMATGKSGAKLIDSVDSDEAGIFREVIADVCIYLAQAIVRDGEGATKFVTLDIKNCNNTDECGKVASAIANSPLVKTALFASDPNWGRILAAVGRSGIENLDIGKINIYIGDICIIEHGQRSSGYTEDRGKEVFSQDEITITVDLNRGNESGRFWTCDFSYDYVRINAEYRS